VFGIASPFRKVNLCVGQNQLNLIVGNKKSTHQIQRQEESLRQVFLNFLRNAEFQNSFLELRDSDIPTKSYLMPFRMKPVPFKSGFMLGFASSRGIWLLAFVFLTS
jgi:hypothetical protein